MTEAQFMQMVLESPVGTRLIGDSPRFEIGMMIAILQYHIPPNITHQGSTSIMPLKFRTHEIKDEKVRKFVEETSEGIHELKVVVWDNSL